MTPSVASVDAWSCSQIIPHRVALVSSHIFSFRPACLRDLPRRYSTRPAQQRAPTGGACWRSGMWRLRVRPRQPSLRGPGRALPGPTTWVRPATGWWSGPNAGESRESRVFRLSAAPSVSRRRSRGRRKNAAVGRREARRSALWIGNPVPLDGMGLAARQTNGRGYLRPRLSAPPLPSVGGAKGSKPTI